MIATDRISAFDYVLGSGIPDKGRVLTQLSAFWFAQTQSIVPHHLVTMDVGAYPTAMRAHAELLRGRSMLVHKTSPVPVECVARGYLSGSGWKEYVATGDRKSTRLNSSHLVISYAVFCLKKKTKQPQHSHLPRVSVE